MDEKIVGFIKVEDVPEGCRDLVDVFGMDVFISLIEYCGGSSLYLPSKGSVVKKARNRVIREEFDGGNFRDLSVRFGISDMQVRKIVR
ncbi:MAG: Mor transcription activator family protein [Paraclostridium sp.]|uniref:Mor transcription activator family protein n=1 Tax=Paraclostridium sp. TaxID=2023273 RepID=UPI003F3DAF0E